MIPLLTYTHTHTETFKYTHVQTYWFVVNYKMYVLVVSPTPKFLYLQCVHGGLYLQARHYYTFEWVGGRTLNHSSTFPQGKFSSMTRHQKQSKLKNFLCSDVNISWSMVSAKDLPTDCVKLYRVITFVQPITMVNVTMKTI